MTPARGGALRLLRVRGHAAPRRARRSIAGQLWIDSATAEVVRLTFRYVGTALWVRRRGGAARARTRPRRAGSTRWPTGSSASTPTWSTGCRTAATGCRTARCSRDGCAFPCVSDVVIPFQATTTFDDYEINGGPSDRLRPPAAGHRRAEPRFSRARCAGRGWTHSRPSGAARRTRRRTACAPGTMPTAGPAAATSCTGRPTSTLDRYEAWPDSLSLEADPAEVRRRSRGRGRARPAGRGAARLGHRAVGARRRPTSGCPTCCATTGSRACRSASATASGRRGCRFANLYGTVRYGLSDDRVTGPAQLRARCPGRPADARAGIATSSTWTRSAPGARSATRSTRSSSRTTTRTTRWPRADRLRFETSLRTGLDLALSGRVERQSGRCAARPSRRSTTCSAATACSRPTRRWTTGTFAGGRCGSTRSAGVRWSLTADVLGGERGTTGRLYGELRKDIGGRRGATLRLKAGDRHQPHAAPVGLPARRARDGARLRVRQRAGARRSGRRSSTWRRSGAASGRWRSWTRARPTAPGDLFSSTALAGAGVGPLALRRRAALRPQPSAHARHRRQGAVRHRRAGGAVSLRSRAARWSCLSGLALACRAGRSGSTRRARGSRCAGPAPRPRAFRAPATAEWCDTLHLLEIRAISGDTGIGHRALPRAASPPGQLSRSGRPTAADSRAAVGGHRPPLVLPDRGARLPGRQRRRVAHAGRGRDALGTVHGHRASGHRQGAARPHRVVRRPPRAAGHAGLHDARRAPPPPAARRDSGAGVD